ncbi:conserved Plasmodium protein, unknown function [Plasmodium berghei]|uniref:Heptatricopeptide repeat-containing protein, putative n=2 Tax=Plasmodium berghei TaxID=5821 RepID=A0A509AJ12_PLABA|nr:heptatricopeptide repeat-containing protein, putative [Plasmodium berghei ANKA]CXI36120.1 conserved Plasmodium protein, unknown function [Plasmodium berghei]SCM21562.1 conserved Plasmodium protein, unknown function [Plasmodium berghei]SCN24763.1 conserved Plasmodium protein, unknown function [Plasmodium berghei]SCO59896.1 conserved Plasmodium protein, unknown function [Plasmodium berghei]SCO61229.1 conserved Plasmodium protein, unknown function [Plasmodium berghei]|eukprot:XP_034421282.1 heptatricopeptide repeat-containing protein, putative [Plasmodium berghei ANKA]
MNVISYSKIYLVFIFTIINNFIYTKHIDKYLISNKIAFSHYDGNKKLYEYKNLRTFFFLSNNGLVLNHKNARKLKRNKVVYAEKIKNLSSLVGGYVKINRGQFKLCNGVILDVRKTDKEEYELLVVINRNQSNQYPQSILNKFGKSYWFNIKDVEIQKLKNLFFHNYNNFYEKKGRNDDNKIFENNQNVGTLKESKDEVNQLDWVSQNSIAENENDETIQMNDIKFFLNNELSENTSTPNDLNDLIFSHDKKKEEAGNYEQETPPESSNQYNKDIDKIIFETENFDMNKKSESKELIKLKENYTEDEMSNPKNIQNKQKIFCHKIVKEIEKNYFYEDLLNLYKTKRHISNIVVCFYILKQLLKIYNFEMNNITSRNNFIKNVIHNNTFELILLDVNKFLEKKQIYRVVDKTWLLWVLVKLNIHKENKYKEIFGNILNFIISYINFNILNKLNTKSICAILWSLAKSGYTGDEKVYEKIIYFLRKYIEILTCQDISNIYYSLSIINYKDDCNFFELLENEINKNINKFTVQSLINILWSMTKQKRNNTTFGLIKDKLLFYSNNLNLRNISIFLWCLQKNNYYKIDINFQGKNFQNLNIKQAMQLLFFFNYNKEKYIEYLKYVLKFLFQNINNLTNHELSFFTYSLSKLQLLDKTFLKIKKNILQRNFKTFNVIDINMIFLSLNNSNIFDKQLLKYLFNALKYILNTHIKPNISLTNNNGVYIQRNNNKIFFENLNYIIKNLSEMKIFDKEIILKYAYLYSSNLCNNLSVDIFSDYLFYTTAIIPLSKKNDNCTEIGNSSEITNCTNFYTTTKQLDNLYTKLLIKTEQIKLKMVNFQKIYSYFLNHIIIFLKKKLKMFEAKSFLSHLDQNYQNKNETSVKSQNNVVDTFTFNYQTENNFDVQKLNELILDNIPTSTNNPSLLKNNISYSEYSTFVNKRKNANNNIDHADNKCDNTFCSNSEKEYSSDIASNSKENPNTNENKFTLHISLNSIIHLFYAFSHLNLFDKTCIDFYFENLYNVINEKKNEITAYQWLIIRDTIKIVNIKNKKEWTILLDNVNTYTNYGKDSKDQIETINIDI